MLTTFFFPEIIGRIQEKFCPILYRVGLHHVATFVEKFQGEAAAEKLRQKIESIGNKVCSFSILIFESFIMNYFLLFFLKPIISNR